MTNQLTTNCKILLVEDEKIALMVNSKLISALGHTHDTAENGTDAVAMSQNGYDIIFMDIGLPDFNGIEATKKIRAFEASNNMKKAKIIALTAFNLSEVGDECFAAGMDDIANKPRTFT